MCDPGRAPVTLDSVPEVAFFSPMAPCPPNAMLSSILRSRCEKDLLRAPDLRAERHLRLVERLEHASPPTNCGRRRDELMQKSQCGQAPRAVGQTKLPTSTSAGPRTSSTGGAGTRTRPRIAIKNVSSTVRSRLIRQSG